MESERIYFNKSIYELEDIFKANEDSPDVLDNLYYELCHRTTKASRLLAEKVREQSIHLQCNLIDISSQFNFLSGAWHLAYYIPKNRPRPIGSLSDYILAFKDNDSYYIERWTKWSADKLSHLNIHFDFIIRSLGSNELVNSGTKGLDEMGKILGYELSTAYVPEVLQKSRRTPPMHTLHTKPEREAAIKGCYFVANRNFDFNNKNVLILDDITTSKTTIKEVVNTLKQEWPRGRYYFFCLAKTSYNISANDNISMTYFG